MMRDAVNFLLKRSTLDKESGQDLLEYALLVSLVVLVAIGAVGENAGASIRFGLGRTTTQKDIDFAIERVTTVVKSLRRAQGSGLTAQANALG